MKRKIGLRSKAAAQPAEWLHWLLLRQFLVYWGILALLMLMLMLMLMPSGCASRAHLSPDFGAKNQTILERQAANPNAPSDKSGPAGLPGTVGENIQKRYTDSFKQPTLTTETSRQPGQ